MKEQPLGLIIAKGVKSTDERHNQMRANIARDLPQFKRLPAHDRRIDICGFAPSIAYTWPEIAGDVLTISGAHGLLLDHGIVPRYHVEVDPRDDKTPYITPPHPECEYLLASVCHPAMFDKVQGFRCTQWHSYNTSPDVDFASDYLPAGTELVLAGSTAGLFSLALAHMMGYRNIHVHGMDSSNKSETERHAGPHYGKKQDAVQIRVGETGERFTTSMQMVSQAREFFAVIDRLPDTQITVHGHGLLQAMIPFEQALKARPFLTHHQMKEAA